jgi:hypothetical protein
MQVSRTIFCVCLLLASAPAVAERAVEEGYGFSVDIPTGFAACGPDLAGHGFGFYLDDRPAAVDDSCARGKRRVITAYAHVAQQSSLTSEANQECGYRKQDGGIEVSTPSALNLGGRPSIACEFNHKAAWIDVLSMTECGLPPPKPHAPGLICSAWMRTTPKFYETDLKVFRATIASIRFFEPRP